MYLSRNQPGGKNHACDLATSQGEACLWRRPQLLGILAILCCWMPLGVCQAQNIVAHRGASFLAPENTLAAFRLAWELGADGIEGDFYLSADGRIVCMHDRDTERVSGEKLVVEDTSFADLRKLDVGIWKGPEWKGERVPTLEEVLATVPRGKKIFIELKMGPEIVGPLAEVLAVATVPHSQIVIISFDKKAIAACEAKFPDIKTYWLTSFKQKEGKGWSPTAAQVIKNARQSGADGIGAKAVPECFNREFLAVLREAGIDDFHVWTVDDPSVAQLYQELGAWGITTNKPDLVKRSLKAQPASLRP